jgi:hypothetical protein
MRFSPRGDHSLTASCRDALQALLAEGCPPVEPEARLLVHFYRHCLRLEAQENCRRLPLPLKSLLARYADLRPAVQAALRTYVVDRWKGFAAKGAGLPSDPFVERVSFAAGRASAPPPVESVFPAPESTHPGAPRQDWFERFLDAVRGLLFL